MKAKSFHFSKKGLAMDVAGEIGRVYECVSDKIPPAYPCDAEKVVFVGAEMDGHLDKPVENFLKDLTPARTKNVAFYVINKDGNTSGFENISKTLEDKGVHVAGDILAVNCGGGLFAKAKISDAELKKAIDWAKDIIENKLAK